MSSHIQSTRLIVRGRKDRRARIVVHIPIDAKLKTTPVIEKAPSGVQFRGHRVHMVMDDGKIVEQIIAEGRIETVKIKHVGPLS